jgi:exopolysaccharide production protein ExoQ
LPPILALALCSAFGIFLLWLDHKQAPDVSPAIWIPTIWMFHIAGKPLAAYFPSSGATAESSPLDRAFLVGLLLFALWILVKRKLDWSRALQVNPWLIALVCYMLISILWSNIPETSFNRWVREIVAVAMAFIVFSESSPRQALESILRRTVYILIPFSLLLVKYYPEYGVDYGRWSGGMMWIGATLHKNGLGRLCLISIFFLLWVIVMRRLDHKKPFWKFQTHVDIFILAIALILMRGPGGGSYSATSITSLAVGLLAFFCFLLMKNAGTRIKAGVLVVIVAFIIIFGIAAVFSGGSNIAFISSSTGRDSTLTGRTAVWAALLPVAMQKPLLGHGFGGFWTPRTMEYFNIPSAHNGYLDTLLELGFVGFSLLFGAVILACRNAHYEQAGNFGWGTLWICFILMAVIHNITESSMQSLTTHLTAVMFFFQYSAAETFKQKNYI